MTGAVEKAGAEMTGASAGDTGCSMLGGMTATLGFARTGLGGAEAGLFSATPSATAMPIAVQTASSVIRSHICISRP